MPRSSPKIFGSTRWTSLITSDSVTVAIDMGLLVQAAPPGADADGTDRWGSGLEVDLGVVAEHEAGRRGPGARPGDLDLPADQRVDQPADADDAAQLEDDRVLDLAVDDLAAVVDRRVRADVAVLDAGVLADDGRPPDGGVHHRRRLGDHDPPVDAGGVVDRAGQVGLDRLEHEGVALEERVELAGVLPP